MNLFIINLILLIQLASGEHFLKSSILYRIIKHARHLTTVETTTKKYSTFVTIIDKNYITPYYSNTNDKNHNHDTDHNSKNLYHIFNGINLNFEQLRIFFVVILLIVIILSILFIFLMKKFCNCFLFKCCCDKLCSSCKQQRITHLAQSESTLSGECRCVFRIRNKNQKNNKNMNLKVNDSNQNLIKEAFLNKDATKPNLKRMISVSLNEIDSKKNYFRKIPFGKVKSALVLITLKPNQNFDAYESVNSISTDKLVARTIISEEDLNEYTENYLIINMQKDLVYLDNINKLKC